MSEASGQRAVYPSLKGKRVLVTGGGSGIGTGVVEAFAAQGSDVIFFDINEEDSKEVARRMGAEFYRVDPTQAKLLAKYLEDHKSEFKSAVENELTNSVPEFLEAVEKRGESSTNDDASHTQRLRERKTRDEENKRPGQYSCDHVPVVPPCGHSHSCG